MLFLSTVDYISFGKQMTEKQVKIVNRLGLHVRPATAFAQIAGKYKSNILVIKDGQTINAKSSIELLTLAAIEGTVLTIKADGDDAEEAANALVKLVESKFGEE